FIGTILITILATQAVVQYDLGQQNEDAQLINIAGRQRTLGQRISKLSLYIQNSVNQSGAPDPRWHHVDSLRQVSERLNDVHQTLANRFNDKEIDTLLHLAGREVKTIVEACRQITESSDPDTIISAVN